MGSCAAPSAKGDDKFITTDYLQQCLFSKLSSCNTGKNWSNEQKYFFEQIFKFITSRNYFAHHYYKDEELNDQVNSLARDVLVSCLNSLLYISALATQVIAWRKK